MGEKILVVEDEEAVLEGITILLEDAGYSVLGLGDGEELEINLEEFRPNLILMDVWLPGRSGVRLVQDIKGIEDWADLPVILMSAKEGVDVRAAEAGADDYLAKPFASEDLLGKVKALLEE